MDDFDKVVSLWNNGDVMHYVGFPDGLGDIRESLNEKWLPYINIIIDDISFNMIV